MHEATVRALSLFEQIILMEQHINQLRRMLKAQEQEVPAEDDVDYLTGMILARNRLEAPDPAALEEISDPCPSILEIGQGKSYGCQRPLGHAGTHFHRIPGREDYCTWSETVIPDLPVKAGRIKKRKKQQ